jgi:hypothetical protein
MTNYICNNNFTQMLLKDDELRNETSKEEKVQTLILQPCSGVAPCGIRAIIKLRLKTHSTPFGLKAASAYFQTHAYTSLYNI